MSIVRLVSALVLLAISWSPAGVNRALSAQPIQQSLQHTRSHPKHTTPPWVTTSDVHRGLDLLQSEIIAHFDTKVSELQSLLTSNYFTTQAIDTQLASLRIYIEQNVTPANKDPEQPKRLNFLDFNSKDTIDTYLKGVEVLLIGIVGGLFIAWRRDSRERIHLFLEERNDVRQERDDFRKERAATLADIANSRAEWTQLAQDYKNAWDQQFQLSKKTLDSFDDIALQVSDKYYRPVLDALMRVNIYTDTYRTVEDIIEAVNQVRSDRPIADTVREMARRHVEQLKPSQFEEDVTAMQQALNGNREILTKVLKDLSKSVGTLIDSGYLNDLKEAKISMDSMQALLNIRYGGLFDRLGDSPNSEKMSQFLNGWTHDLKLLNEIQEKGPWGEFCVLYRNKLRDFLS